MKMQDNEIFALIEEERERQTKGLELIASENYVSNEVMAAMGSIITNKYAEGYPKHRYYGGCEVVDKIETLAQERLKKLFDAEYVNVQPHSGSQANMTVMVACLKAGDTILGMGLQHGGHLTHGASVSFSGMFFNAISYNVKAESGLVDYEQLEALAQQHKPKLIIGGASSYSREWDYARIRAVADEVGALFMVDMAHPAGIIAAGLLNNPVKYAHIVTSTTHKTLRGPRGGIILMGKDFPNPFGKKNAKGEVRMMSSLLDSALFPGIQGGPLQHVVAAKAIAFKEALTPAFKEYQQQVLRNAKAMAQAFLDRGYKVLTGGTENHSFLIDLREKFPNLTGAEAAEALVTADITSNKNMIPYDTRSAAQTSGLRFGTPAITTRGLKTEQMEWVAEMIDQTLKNYTGNRDIAAIKAEVNKVMNAYPLFAW